MNSWDEAKLLQLIHDRIEESFELEYKAAGTLARNPQSTTEMTKDISSMAKASGGTIIYGIAEFKAKDKRHLPERLDPVSGTSFSKEWIEHVVAQISPRIPDLRIHPVLLSSGLDHVAYAIEVPQSVTAHQAVDCRYYRRYNFESVRMIDYEIRDVMNRRKHPHVSLSARFVIYPPNPNRDDGSLIFSITNDSEILVLHFGLIVNAPIRFNEHILLYTDAIRDEVADGAVYRLGFANRDGVPLFPRSTRQVFFKFHWISRQEPMPKREASRFQYAVYADAMPKMEGGFAYTDILPEKS
jgi:hypothetical protein